MDGFVVLGNYWEPFIIFAVFNGFNCFFGNLNW